MKRILVIIALCSPLLMQAQSIEHILKSIEQNNKELKAQKHAADATKMENRTKKNMEIQKGILLLPIQMRQEKNIRILLELSQKYSRL